MNKVITSLEEMKKIAQEVLATVVDIYKKGRQDALVIALRGDLGAGKTTFAQCLCHCFCVKESITSPTYVIQKTYKTSGGDGNSTADVFGGIEKIHHIDAYRLEKPEELQVLGFERLLKDNHAIVLIEWPEKADGLLPADTKYIDFTFINENTRSVEYNWGNGQN